MQFLPCMAALATLARYFVADQCWIHKNTHTDPSAASHLRVNDRMPCKRWIGMGKECCLKTYPWNRKRSSNLNQTIQQCYMIYGSLFLKHHVLSGLRKRTTGLFQRQICAMSVRCRPLPVPHLHFLDGAFPMGLEQSSVKMPLDPTSPDHCLFIAATLCPRRCM
jgi:hypothetical protein